MANPNERIRVIVEPDTSGFARELQSDLQRINTELTVDVLADTEPAAAEIKATKTKAEATPVEIPVLADTLPAKAEVAKATATMSKPITKIINASVGPALAKVREFTAQASKPIIKTVTLITTGAIGSLRALDAKANATFASMSAKARLAAGKMSGAFSQLGRIGSTALLPIGAGVAIAGIELKKGAEDAKAFSLVTTEMNQAIKLFGGQTGINAKQISDLAGKYKEFTSISGGSIKSSTAALLKFGVVNQKNLPEITKLLLDTAVGMRQVGEDGKISGAFATKFGRALQDPTKGLSLLARAGVPVSISQKEVIKSLIESGRVAEATGKVQELLASKFSGAATEFGKSIGGQFRIASHEFEEARRDIAVRILPSIAPVIKTMSHQVAAALNANQKPITNFVTGFVKGAGAVLKFITGSKPFHQVVSGIAAVISGIARGLKGFALGFASAFTGGRNKTAKSFGETIKDLGTKIGDVAQKWLPMLGTILGTVLGAVSKHTTTLKLLVGAFIAWKAIVIGVNIAVIAYNAVLIAAEVATGAWKAAQWLLNAALRANPIGLVITAIIALVAIFVIAWKHSETFRNIVKGAFHAVRIAVVAVVNGIKKAIVVTFNAIISFIKKWGPLLLAAMTGPIGLAVFAIIKNWDKLKSATSAAFSKIKDGIMSKLGAVLNFVRGFKDRIVNIFKNAGGWLFGIGGDIIGGLKDGLLGGWHKIEKWLSGLKDKIIHLKGPPAKDSTLLVDNGQRIMSGLHEGMKHRWGPIDGWLGGITSGIKSLFGHGDTVALSNQLAQVLAGNQTLADIKPQYNEINMVSGLHKTTGWPDTKRMVALIERIFHVGMTSGLRLGAVTASGHVSQHALGEAADFGTSRASISALNNLATVMSKLVGSVMNQVIWMNKLWAGGFATNQFIGGHMDHVHLGWLHKRAGGRTNAGQPMIVGETGQEGFIPDRPGMIISNNKLNMLLALGNRVTKIEAMLGGRRTSPTGASIRERPMIQQTNDITLIHPSNDPSSIMAALNSRLDMFARTAVSGFAV